MGTAGAGTSLWRLQVSCVHLFVVVMMMMMMMMMIVNLTQVQSGLYSSISPTYANSTHSRFDKTDQHHDQRHDYLPL